MAMKQNIYISGPRMGTNNWMYGIELKNAPKPYKSTKPNGKAKKPKKK
jgi:hypothetical protein